MFIFESFSISVITEMEIPSSNLDFLGKCAINGRLNEKEQWQKSVRYAGKDLFSVRP